MVPAPDYRWHERKLRASKQDQNGNTGVSDVCSNFQRIGWGPARNDWHDLGTDLFVQVRDDTAFDGGLVIGVQVKSGESYFSRPSFEPNGEINGWWYHERDTRHFDYWVDHALPHLLVLHDLDSRRSYWAHVTLESIVKTGRGCKILVPSHQKIDEHSVDGLLAVATSQQAADTRLEGTAWYASAKAVAPGAALRHALITPRLIAPHPNAGVPENPAPEEAIAYLVQGRYADFERLFQENKKLAHAYEQRAHDNWLWCFAFAFSDWAFDGNMEGMSGLSEQAPSAWEQAAALVCTACALSDVESFVSAEHLLSSTDTEYSPVDSAWLLIQRARARIELGKVADARQDLVSAQHHLLGVAKDISATVLAGSAAALLFDTAEMFSRHLVDVIPALDTAGNWWRSQRVATALSHSSERAFKSWTQSETITYVAEDEVLNGLHGAALNAQLAGAYSAWRGHLALLSKHRIMDASPGEHHALGEGVDGLRRAGDEKSVGTAAGAIWNNGPLKPLEKAVSDVPLDSLYRSSLLGNLALWKQAADLLPDHQADRLATQVIEILAGDHDHRLAGIRPNALLEKPLYEVLARALTACSPETHVLFTAKLAEGVLPANEFAAGYVRRAICSIDFQAADEYAIGKLRDWAIELEQGDIAATALRRTFAAGDDVSRSELNRRASEGDDDAGAECFNAGILDPSIVPSMIERHLGVLATKVSEAKRSTFSYGSFDSAHLVALLNLHFPDCARWRELVEFLATPEVVAEHKSDACKALARQADKLPSSARQRLCESITIIEKSRTMLAGDNPISGVAAELAVSLDCLSAVQLADKATQLLHGSPADRQAVCRLSRHVDTCTAVPYLLALARDNHIHVRGMAAARLVELTAEQDIPETVFAAIRYLREQDGCVMPLALLHGLADRNRCDALADDIIDDFSHHPSAVVRRAALNARKELPQQGS